MLKELIRPGNAKMTPKMRLTAGTTALFGVLDILYSGQGVGCAASIGFTVVPFVSTVASPFGTKSEYRKDEITPWSCQMFLVRSSTA
jgi:hypothetical protein